jgi:hypothetical protein
VWEETIAGSTAPRAARRARVWSRPALLNLSLLVGTSALSRTAAARMAPVSADVIPARLENPGVLCGGGMEALVAPRVGEGASFFRADRRPAFPRLRWRRSVSSLRAPAD